MLIHSEEPKFSKAVRKSAIRGGQRSQTASRFTVELIANVLINY